MFDRLINYFRDKKILILGFGREGKSTYHFLRQFLPDQELFIADQKTLDDPELIRDEHVTLISGPGYLNDLQNYDIIMKSPGISLKDIDTSSYREKLKSQLELALEFLNLKTIGITGTKGKSTTSSLIYQILQDQSVPSLLLGNIGTPIFEHFNELEPDMTVVLEMSSHQLEFTTHSPHIAVLLNVYEEHLDYYTSFSAYAEAKCNIFKYQHPKDYFIYNADDEVLRELIQNPPADTFRISFKNKSSKNEATDGVYLADGKVYCQGQVIYDVASKRQLLGDYNLHNIIFALVVAKILGLDLTQAARTVSKFKTLKHRLEFVGKFNNIYYYDNAIGTIPMATIEAIKALGQVDTLIVGGMDRGVDQTKLIDFLRTSAVHNVICMPETGNDIAKALPGAQAHPVNTLAEAVALARKITPNNGTCLLSPSAASYGTFKNFEEKGNAFQKLVRGVV